jgi:hypothetical protein
VLAQLLRRWGVHRHGRKRSKGEGMKKTAAALCIAQLQRRATCNVLEAPSAPLLAHPALRIRRHFPTPFLRRSPCTRRTACS